MKMMKGGISVHIMVESIIGASELVNSEEYISINSKEESIEAFCESALDLNNKILILNSIDDSFDINYYFSNKKESTSCGSKYGDFELSGGAKTPL